MARGERLTAGVGEILRVLAGSNADAPRVVCGPGVDPDLFGGDAEVMGERDLVGALRDNTRWVVVVVNRVGPTLLRTLRDAPPPLLISTGETRPSQLAGRPALGHPNFILGPHARMHRGPGDTVVCAHEREQLEQLVDCVGSVRVRLGLCPTPPWLATWLDHDELRNAPTCGYVGHGALTPELARWSLANEQRHVLIPIGLHAPTLAEPRDGDVRAAAVAHALERLTGPVVPCARVMALLLAALTRPREHPDPPPGTVDLWSQAQRALPLAGATTGVITPDATFPLTSPTDAFLAQYIWKRVQSALEIRVHTLEAPTHITDTELTRAFEVLRGAGTNLTDHESKVVLRGLGLEVTRQAVANSASGAAGFADRIGYPVVLRALSPDLRRRVDVGGVALALDTAAAVRRAYAAIVGNLERLAPTARIDGILVGEMLEESLDIHCGGLRLETGDVVLYGVVKDVRYAEPTFAFAPLTAEDAVAFAHSILSGALVPSFRRHGDPDVSALATLFLRLQVLFQRTEDRVRTVDLGPVRHHPQRGYVALDAKITQQAHLQGL